MRMRRVVATERLHWAWQRPCRTSRARISLSNPQSEPALDISDATSPTGSSQRGQHARPIASGPGICRNITRGEPRHQGRRRGRRASGIRRRGALLAAIRRRASTPAVMSDGVQHLRFLIGLSTSDLLSLTLDSSLPLSARKAARWTKSWPSVRRCSEVAATEPVAATNMPRADRKAGPRTGPESPPQSPELPWASRHRPIAPQREGHPAGKRTPNAA